MISHRFNKILLRLADYSDRVRHKKIDDNDAVTFYKEESNILSSYRRGEITRGEYETLNRLFFMLQDATRETIHKGGDIYTETDWSRDRSFKAIPGQEITETIYNQMRDCMPPKALQRGKARQAMEEYELPIHAGFMMGEPNRTDTDGEPLYMAFGMNDYGKGKRFFYLGLAREEKKLNGSYYYFECGNAFVEGLYKTTSFESDAEAVRKAADYESTLYKYEYQDGEQVRCDVLYDPI